MRRDGFTLLEVLLALLIVTAGVLGFLGALGSIARLAAEGRERGRIALALESRLDRLRADVGGANCRIPATGTLERPDGVVESWSAEARAGSVEILATARVGGRPRAPDSVLARVPCR